MIVMKIQNKNGYSLEIANKYVSGDKDLYWVSSFEEIQYRYEDNQRTNEIAAYKYYFAQEGLNPFAVKFEKKIKSMPEFLSKVKLVGLEGIEVRNNVYFKAQDIEVVE